MANLSPYLGALGSFFGGLGQDQQNQFQRQRALATDAEATQMHQAQIRNYDAQDEDRRASAAQRLQAAREAEAQRNAITQHLPIILDPNADPVAKRTSMAALTAVMGKEAPAMLKDLNPEPEFELKATDQGMVRVPKKGPVGVVMGPNGQPLGKPLPEPISPYQQAQLRLAEARLKWQQDAQAAKAKIQTPDQIKMQTLNQIAGPAADRLTAYMSNPTSLSEGASALASHVPLVGHAAANLFDEPYQTAVGNAETLATQYLEALPRGRYSAGGAKELAKQIAPVQGDSPAQRKMKMTVIREIQRAIKLRAGSPTDAPDADLGGSTDPEFDALISKFKKP